MLAQLPDDALDAGPRKTAHGAERLCAATGTVRPIDDMIRFVLSPEGAAVPDLKRRLPGRGVWITATRSALVHDALHARLSREVSSATSGCRPTWWTPPSGCLNARRLTRSLSPIRRAA
jgi:predicted RNA-binding protein YlxR (DUF448 family)